MFLFPDDFNDLSSKEKCTFLHSCLSKEVEAGPHLTTLTKKP